MKVASISELKRELVCKELTEVQDLCIRLAKYKKENKELLNYLLFEADDEAGYIEKVKTEIKELFDELPRSNLYLVKKSLRKILRITNKQIKYSSAKKTEIELRIYFCASIKKSGINMDFSIVLFNLYQQQIKKINQALATLPEDLQYDYFAEIENL